MSELEDAIARLERAVARLEAAPPPKSEPLQDGAEIAAIAARVETALAKLGRVLAEEG